MKLHSMAFLIVVWIGLFIGTLLIVGGVMIIIRMIMKLFRLSPQRKQLLLVDRIAGIYGPFSFGVFILIYKLGVIKEEESSIVLYWILPHIILGSVVANYHLSLRKKFALSKVFFIGNVLAATFYLLSTIDVLFGGMSLD